MDRTGNGTSATKRIEGDASPGCPETRGADATAGESRSRHGECPGADRGCRERPQSEADPVTTENEHVQKRIKRASRKELLDLIQRKNAMLMELDKEAQEAKQDLAVKEDRLLRLAAEFENLPEADTTGMGIASKECECRSHQGDHRGH